MTVDVGVVPGLLLLAAEFLALSAVGFVVARVALRQTDDRLALAQELVIGLALWGLIVNFILHVLPGMAGALAGWIVVLALGAALAWQARQDLHVPAPTLAGFGLAGTAIFWIALVILLQRLHSQLPYAYLNADRLDRPGILPSMRIHQHRVFHRVDVSNRLVVRLLVDSNSCGYQRNRSHVQVSRKEWRPAYHDLAELHPSVTRARRQQLAFRSPHSRTLQNNTK